MNNFNVAVLNMAGGVGKTTYTKHGLVPLIPNAVRVSIEDWNSGDGKADLELGATAFYKLAAQLNTDDEQSFVIDIGTSNSKQMLQHFSDLELTTERINYWILPVRSGSKERIDTLKTVSKLMEIDIDPARIVVVAQAVSDIGQFEADFGPLVAAARSNGFCFAEQAVLFNEVYNLTKGSDQTVFDILRNKPDFKLLRQESAGNEQKLLEIGNQMLIYSLAKTATRNLLSVFQSTPLADALVEAAIEKL